MKITDFSLTNFNSTIRSTVASQELNFCQAVSLSYDYNLSVTAKYTPDGCGDRFVTLDKSLNPISSDSWEMYYYGVSPQIDSHEIITAISEFKFSTLNGLDSFIADNCMHFMLHKDHSAYLADFARHSVITLAGKYGIRIGYSKELYELLRPFDEEKEILKEEALENNNKCLLLCGCPTLQMCDILEKYRYTLKDNIWHIDEHGISLKDIYADKKNIVLLCGNVFYSGVLIKPLKIVHPEERFENYKMKNVSIEFERTTFASVCAFDEVHIMHPLLKDSVQNLSRLFYYDDQCKLTLNQMLSNKESYSEDYVWDCVNQYLQNCLNINQIGVSASIVTKDNRLLLGLRKSKNIDEGCLYPGVNGNAEIKDDNVAFYTYSVYEDDPKIQLESRRIDFTGEISREAYAEIKLDCNNWLCCGFILSGQLPTYSTVTPIYSQKRRRMHFNILFEKNCEQTHEEIEINKNKATESFETGDFLGLQIHCYKNFFDWMIKSVVSLLNGIINNKDFIESIALILIFTSTLSRNGNYKLEWLDFMSYGFAALISIVTVIKIFNFLNKKYTWNKWKLKKRLTTKTVRIFCGQSYKKLCKKIDRIFNNSCHPAAYAATKQHIENLVYDMLSEREKN